MRGSARFFVRCMQKNELERTVEVISSMRLFFALWPPEKLAEKLSVQADWLAKFNGGRATRRETIHLTLAFLGEVEPDHLGTVMEAARRVQMPAFELSIDRLGHWRHNRLFWAGCHCPVPELEALARVLHVNLRKASIFYDESHGFSPHLTLVRKTDNASIPRWNPLDYESQKPMRWKCDHFVLVRSSPDSGGMAYSRLAEFPLIASKSVNEAEQ